MNLPDKIIECIEALPQSIKGEVYCAVVSYIRTEIFVASDFSEASASEFANIREILDPILRRRKRAAAYRLRKKQEKLAKESEAVTPDETSSVVQKEVLINEIGVRSSAVNVQSIDALSLIRRKRLKADRKYNRKSGRVVLR